jgi:hypothetical protein
MQKSHKVPPCEILTEMDFRFGFSVIKTGEIVKKTLLRKKFWQQIDFLMYVPTFSR